MKIRLQKISISIALVAFLALGVFGLANFGMTMSADGHMSGCPFMGMAAVCQMNPFEHISALQNMFLTTAAENTLALLLLTIIATVGWIGNIFGFRLYPEVRAPLLRRLPIFSFTKSSLEEAYSNGILNPKIF